ncbi:MAG: ABC transporter substrate binding protein, partial [Planctomycetota bacterium]
DAAGVEAIWIPIDITIYENLELVRNVSDPLGIPLVSSSLRGAEAGAVAGVLVDYALLGQNAVVIALDILDGVRTPGEIPIGTMQGYQVIVNLTAARRCRYELPLAVLAVADRLIEPEGEGFR